MRSSSGVNQENVHKLEAYVEELALANQMSGSVNIQKILDDVVKLWNVVKLTWVHHTLCFRTRSPHRSFDILRRTPSHCSSQMLSH